MAMYAAAGLPRGEWKAFDQLIQNESSWDPTAKNPGSTAFGLGQFLDTTAKEYGIPYGTRDPMVQLPAIFAYIKNRYHGSPREALNFWNSHTPHWYDKGGWLPPGQTTVINDTGKPELVIPHDNLVRGFYPGGYVDPRTGVSVPVPPGPQPPVPNPRDKSQPQLPPAQAPMQPQPNKQIGAPPQPIPQPPPPQAIPQPMPPTVTPSPPPMAAEPHMGTGEQPGPAGQAPSNAVQYGPNQIQPPTPDAGMHVHPALQTGIMSTASTLGNLASSAMSMGMGGMGGGMAGSMVEGLFKQAGKIAVNIANVPASFLVGNITGGTTANAYGVTQRGNNPTGGTRVIDASNNINGDIYTNNLDDYFARVRRMDDQRAQATLGHWAR
jgi:hypothetical protein